MRTEIAFLLLLGISPGVAANLTPADAAEFDHYVTRAEAELQTRQASQAEPRLRSSGSNPWIEPVNGGTHELRRALLHHWHAASLVLKATPSQMLMLLRDYEHLSLHYAPEIASSRVLTGVGDEATIALRLREQRVVTVVLDAEYRVNSRLENQDRGFSFSRSTHIWEVAWPGTDRERRQKEGDDDGFLWRLNSYWTFRRVGDGLLIECEAISLTRDIPAGLGWLIAPFIQDLPRQMLASTMEKTKEALLKEAH